MLIYSVQCRDGLRLCHEIVLLDPSIFQISYPQQMRLNTSTVVSELKRGKSAVIEEKRTHMRKVISSWMIFLK